MIFRFVLYRLYRVFKSFWACSPWNGYKLLSWNIFQSFIIFFKFWGNFGAQIEKIWKIQRKWKIKQTQVCFANISATKHWIFTKFYMVVNYYLVNLSFKFHEDPCINARARVINACAHDFARVRAFMTCVRASMHGSSWNLKLKLTR